MERRTVWITGASQGIGRATALRYAQAGALVLASARGADGLAALAAAAKDLPGSIAPLPLDVTDRQAVLDAIQAAEPRYGPIATAILNAGTHQAVLPDRFSSEPFERLFRLNVMGVVHCLEALLPRYVRRGGGQVALMGSVAGYRGLRTAAAYGATKAALINMAEALRADYEALGVDVRLISPGFVRTPLTDRNPFPMPFIIPAEAAAERIWRGLEQGRRFEIAFPGRFVVLLKTLRIMPFGLYRAITRRATGG